MFVLRMGGVADGIEVFGIAWRTADIFRRARPAASSKSGRPSVGVLSNHFSSLITWSQLSPKS